MRVLNRLLLGRNTITSTIPADIGVLTLLTTLDVSENQFYGIVPLELVSLTKSDGYDSQPQPAVWNVTDGFSTFIQLD